MYSYYSILFRNYAIFLRVNYLQQGSQIVIHLMIELETKLKQGIFN